MKHLRLILSIIFSIFITFSVSACSKNDDNDLKDNTEFVGIAFIKKLKQTTIIHDIRKTLHKSMI